VEVTPSAARVRAACDEARAAGRTIGFVATMGALHEGHRSLVERARTDGGFVVMSIFVNPLQFGPDEDFAAYPRDAERDLELAEEWGCELTFTPTVDEVYPAGQPEVLIDPGPLGARLEGAARPGFFQGVLTVVAKLFNTVGPCRAYFGEKDAQQLALVRRMVADLNFPVLIVGCPIVRGPDGLALSSRNSYLSAEERLAARCLGEALREALVRHEEGDRSAAALMFALESRIKSERLADLDYVAVVDEATWEDVQTLDHEARALVAARFGRARLIDNMRLPATAPAPAPAPPSVHNSRDT
jgi:pantoate--beta-alanine ligase